jgi:hypothetical protein
MRQASASADAKNVFLVGAGRPLAEGRRIHPACAPSVVAARNVLVGAGRPSPILEFIRPARPTVPKALRGGFSGVRAKRRREECRSAGRPSAEGLVPIEIVKRRPSPT